MIFKTIYKRRKKFSLIRRSLLVCAVLGVCFLYRDDFARFIPTTGTIAPNLKIGIIGTLEGIQPATIQTNAEKFIASMSFEALTYYDQTQQKLIPQAATSWQFSEDASVLTFEIAPDLTFHNGKKVTAAEVKASWERSFMAGENWKKAHLIKGIQGVGNFLNGISPEISGIQAEGRSLRIVFDTPNTAFPYIVTQPLFWIADPENEDGIPAGTGPYVVQERTNRQLTLSPNLHDRGKNLPFSQITVRCSQEEADLRTDFERNQLEAVFFISGKTAEQFLENHPDSPMLHQQPLMEYYLLGFNQGLQPFYGNTALRQALNYMVDREKIIAEITGPGFIPAKGPIPQGIAAYRPQILGYTHAPEQAESLLQRSGYTGKSYVENLLLSYHSGTGHQFVLEETARQLRRYGIQIQLREADWNSYIYQLPRMGYSFFRLSWQGDYPDADDFLYSLYHSDNLGITNYTGFQNPQVDALLDSARRAVREEDRIRLQQQAEDIILDQAPQLWLFQKEMLSLISPDITGCEINVSGFPDWKKVQPTKTGGEISEKS